MFASHAVAGIAAAASGWLLWTLTEYVMHRFSFHHSNDGPVRRTVAWEHSRHHRDPNRTNLALRLGGQVGVAALGVPFGIAFALATSTTLGVGLWIGWAGGYVIYETTHWRIHHRVPTSPTATRRRHHHLAHHAVNASVNFGVTVRWWDRTFGTVCEPPVVALPPSHAPSWLLEKPDDHGCLVVGRGSQQIPS
jgi:sterol desaturase/sphingolipid hydroxylase (fatty acid hydroxylase superfamily)